MSTTLQRSALVFHSAEAMYNLVNDVASYPRFMAGCVGAEVLESSQQHMVARLDLRKAGVKYSFTTCNTLHPHNTIDIELENGPFRKLKGQWQFQALAENACKVSLKLEFEMQNSLVGVAASSLFASVANSMVTTFTDRADQLYGRAAYEQ